jgi:hypothetical protein
MFIETNYQTILAEIAKVPLKNANILLSTKVIGVKSVERESPGGKVLLTTESGQILPFDEVIMTTPLGWLKRNENIFDPPLPPRMLAGIDAISVGHLEKVDPHSQFHPQPNKSRSISPSPMHSGSTYPQKPTRHP